MSKLLSVCPLDNHFNLLTFCGHTRQKPNGGLRAAEMKACCALTQLRKVIQLLILGEKFYLSFLFRDGGQGSAGQPPDRPRSRVCQNTEAFS